ncbi:MAG: choice-of-anchor A family protein [Verrucomicrobia bacterium]|nr:choice-of-anchor A family protein [Verrucomicrobiota bacterium]MCH8526820.1 choice-of-anchor A family protein [Kiritimatiellia bacterium]
MNIAFKAGPGYTTGKLCGPSGGCDESEIEDELSSIGDWVWLDANANGIQDPHEDGVPGITVRLLTHEGDVLKTAVTDAGGYYLFEDLVEGEYRVEFVLPHNAAYTFTKPKQGSDSEKDSNADKVTGKTGLIVLPAGTHRRDIDAGLVATTASIRIVKDGVFVPGTLDPWSLCNVFGSAHAFNALIFGDFTPLGGDTEGRLAVAGNAIFPENGYSVGFALMGHPVPEHFGDGTDMLIVGGDLTDGVFGVNGNIVVGGNRTGPVRWMVNGNLLRHVNPIRFDHEGNVPASGEGLSFAEMKGFLQARSVYLGNRIPNGTVNQKSDWIWVLEGDDPDLNVFQVHEGAFRSQQLKIRAPESSTVLVNFMAQEVEFRYGGVLLEGPDKEKTVFNFPNAHRLKTAGFQIDASVLAPFADGIFSGGSIDGRAVLGGDVVSEAGFEFHNFYFKGEVCLDSHSLSNPPAVEYTFTVENTGDVPLTNIRVEDPLVHVNGGPISLLPGESDSTTFTATLLLTALDLEEERFLNTALVYAETESGHSISHSDTHELIFPEPEPLTPPTLGVYPVGNKADFVIQSLIVSSEINAFGQEFDLTIIVSNLGDKPGDADVLRIWPSVSGQVKPEDPFVDVDAGFIKVGESRLINVSGLTASSAAGSSHVRVVVNPDQVTDEYSFGNNHLMHFYFLHNPEAAWMKPDFVVRSVSLSPAPVTTGARYNAVVQVANEGSRSGDAGTLGLWPAHGAYTRDLPAPVLETAVGELAAGEVKTFTFENLRAPDVFGTFHTLAVVNVGATLEDETSIMNNHAGATFTIHPVSVEMSQVADGSQITWNSAPGFYYFVERATSLDGDFEQIAFNLPATPPVNTFVDADPPVGGVVFYKVWGYKP